HSINTAILETLPYISDNICAATPLSPLGRVEKLFQAPRIMDRGYFLFMHTLCYNFYVTNNFLKRGKYGGDWF
ncbi:MAG: hypothetical protein ACK40U_05080, partial [Fervidobacterium pennivorans]